MSSTASAAIPQTSILSQLSKLLEFTRDISRNESDTNFAEAGGKIIYVFDTNVFELFIEPDARSRYAEIFHSPVWLQDRPNISELRNFSAQSALVAAEFLFSGRLPGQENSYIHMTEWHFGELASRRLDLTTSLKEEFAALTEGSASSSAKFQGLAETATNQLAVDDLTESDAKLFALQTSDASAIQRFRETRLAARYLVQDNYLIKVHQLKRIGSKEIAENIIPLSMRFRPNEVDREIIRNNRQDLLKALREECSRRNVNLHFGAPETSSVHIPPKPRSDGALQNDADTLAYIQWIAATQLGPKERIVLVTGDSVLFDVYRSWFIRSLPGTPFVLRRITQYAPIINLNSAPSDVANTLELFQSTKEAVEAALFVLNWPMSSKEIDSHHRGREALAYALSQSRGGRTDDVLSSFVSKLNKQWYEERQQTFSRLIQLWQQMERFVVGTNYDLVMTRYKLSDVVSAKNILTVDGKGAFVEYLKGILNELVSGSIRLFFPFAVSFIRTAAAQHPGRDGHAPRAPIVLCLNIPGTASMMGAENDEEKCRFEIHDILAKNAIQFLDIEHCETLSRRPDIVYMLASTLALEANNWNDAERFSELAKSAEPLDALDVAERENDRFEAIYLSAVAKRFRIGSIEPPKKIAAGSDVWWKLLEGASDSLNQCELHHSQKGEILRQLRSVSERAAVRLFYVAWGAVAYKVHPMICEGCFPHMLDQFDYSLRDLRTCLYLENEIKRSTLGVRRKKFFGRIERQYITNLASSYVLAYLLTVRIKESVRSLSTSEQKIVQDRIEVWGREINSQTLPYPAQADILAFDAVQSRRSQELKRFVGSAIRSRSFALPIDRAYAEAVLSELV
jgi:hypothetical protein